MAKSTSENGIPEHVRSAQDRFIATWGQMGSAWGISRTMAEVHALLYITGQPLCTDDVMERLQISRGNASMSLRALVDWGIVVRSHKRGDRKEYYEAEADVWVMFRTIARERKKREIDPVIAGLFEIRDMTDGTGAKRSSNGSASAEALDLHNKRLDAMLEFIGLIDSLSQSFLHPEGRGLRDALDVLSESKG